MSDFEKACVGAGIFIGVVIAILLSGVIQKFMAAL